MTNYETSKILKTETILIDTREQNTEELKRRIRLFPCGTERKKLNAGDYSIQCTMPDERVYSLDEKVVIERKMSLDEIANNLGNERARFIREFERAKAKGTKVYVLIENASYEKIILKAYRSKMSPKQLLTSLSALEARYDLHVKFCSQSASPLIMYDILHYELREALLNDKWMDKT